MALQRILTRLPANFPAPILLIQHMPGAFTTAFAERLDKLCQITVKEAQDGDTLRPGVALLAPGGKQMMIGNFIELQFGQGRNWPLGASLSMLLLLIVLAALLFYVRAAGKGGAHGQ